MERRHGSRILCAHLIESWTKEPYVQNVEFQVSDENINVMVTGCDGKESTLTFKL